MSLVLVDRNVRPHVSVITLNKPERLNSMSFPLVEALYEALDEVGNDNDSWVVVLTGAGRGFCSGLDLHDRGMPPNTQDLGFSRLAMRSMSYMSDVVPAMRRIPQPVIAAINGPAYGGGMCLTLGADLRYASESAVFCSAGISNGLTSSELGATCLLPRAVGTVERGRDPAHRPQDRCDRSAARRTGVARRARRRHPRLRARHRGGDDRSCRVSA